MTHHRSLRSKVTSEYSLNGIRKRDEDEIFTGPAKFVYNRVVSRFLLSRAIKRPLRGDYGARGQIIERIEDGGRLSRGFHGKRKREKMLAHAYSWPEPWIMPGVSAHHILHSWNINSCHSYAMRVQCCRERKAEEWYRCKSPRRSGGFSAIRGMIEGRMLLRNLNWLDPSNYFSLIWIN